MTDETEERTLDAQVEAQEFLENRIVRKRLFPRAILVGLASGGIASAFRFSLEQAEGARVSLLAQLPTWTATLLVGLIAGLGTLVAMLLGSLDRDSGGSGIPHMKAVLEGHATMQWARLVCVKFTAAVAAIGTGLALGREGPTVQMGGASGLAVADFTGATGRERRALAAAGAGAGLAAAFNAPLAGVTFVLEELQRDFQPVVFGAALLSAAVATVVSRIAAGQHSAFSVPPIPAPALHVIPLFIVIGAVSGLVGVAFNKGLMSSCNILGKLRDRSKVAVALLMGVAAAAVYLISPALLGGGHGLTELALYGKLLAGPALIFLVARMAFVHVSYATGVPGGIFAPLLSIGALLGLVAFHLSQGVIADGPSVAACVVAGMCGLFSGVVRAPLTGIILIAEMTGSYDMLLPLLAAAFTAYAVAEATGDMPIYEALLQRQALKRGWQVEEGQLQFVELEVKSHSSFEGRAIRDLGLLDGVLIVLCREGGQEFIPTADTVLHAHMRLVIGAATEEGLRQVALGLQMPPGEQ